MGRGEGHWLSIISCQEPHRPLSPFLPPLFPAVFSRTNSTVHITFTYDPKINFMQAPSLGDAEGLSALFGGGEGLAALLAAAAGGGSSGSALPPLPAMSPRGGPEDTEALAAELLERMAAKMQSKKP